MLLGDEFEKEQKRLLKNKILAKKEKRRLMNQKGLKEIVELKFFCIVNHAIVEPCFLIEKDKNFNKNIKELKKLVKKENISNDDVIYFESFKNIETFIFKKFKMITIKEINIL